jgi:hypothetical protein
MIPRGNYARILDRTVMISRTAIEQYSGRISSNCSLLESDNCTQVREDQNERYDGCEDGPAFMAKTTQTPLNNYREVLIK